MHDEDSAMPIMGDGSAGRPAGVECACVRAWPAIGLLRWLRIPASYMIVRPRNACCMCRC
jgi:hypothetical protein